MVRLTEMGVARSCDLCEGCRGFRIGQCHAARRHVYEVRILRMFSAIGGRIRRFYTANG